MAERITDTQRSDIIRLLEEGLPRDAIAAVVGVTPGQVSAVAAHVTMRTYDQKQVASTTAETSTPLAPARGQNARNGGRTKPSKNLASWTHLAIPLGRNPESNHEIQWLPSPASGTSNPHMLIVGESGSGKTYTVQCICAELVQRQMPVVVFDYAQGFVTSTVGPEFKQFANPVELNAARDGIDINPLTIFPSDLYGPVNVAQRLADTFSRVYPKIGVQQHAVLRDAIIMLFEQYGIYSGRQETWHRPAPTLDALREKLNSLAEDSENPNRRHTASVASHISTFFVFNTFRGQGVKIDWEKILSSHGATVILQLKGLEHSLERIVTELLLWNLVGYLESIGPGSLRCFILLDEAHRLSFDENSPVERLLREGRKFGIGVILASQQPEDFSAVAFSNTATKLIFNLLDRTGDIARQIASRAVKRETIVALVKAVGTLRRGTGVFIGNETASLVEITSMPDRRARWESQG